MAAGEDITYECVDYHHTVAGTTSKTHKITCGATGRWDTGGWPTCRTQCVVPTTADTMYRDERDAQ